MVSPLKIATAKVSGWWVVGGGIAAVALVWAWVTRRGGETILGALGRQVGGGAASVATGAVGGAVSGIQAATGEVLDALGVPALPSGEPGQEWNAPVTVGASFSADVSEGLAPIAMLTNLVGLQGLLIYHGPGDYEYLVQNAGELDLALVTVTLRRDGPNLTPIIFPVTERELLASTQVRGRGQITPGGQARLYANGFLMDQA